MKLIFCPQCHDVVKLIHKPRSCECGLVLGYYGDNITAVISSNAIPLGFDNSSFTAALRNRTDGDPVSKFEAFVIPRNCKTVRTFRTFSKGNHNFDKE